MRFHSADAAKTRSKPVASLVALAAGLIVLAGCGGSSSTSSSASTPAAAATPTTESSPAGAPAATTASEPASANSNLSLEANSEGQLKFDKTSLSAKAGKISIDFTNMASDGHNMTVASSSGAVLGATPTFAGGSKTLTLHLKPGTYKFYCSVPGHRMAGMEGTLTVN